MAIDRKKTQLPHVFLVDVDDNGLDKEIAIMKEDSDGTIYYLDIAMLHPLDKQRLKKIISSVHADKYPLWELMSQSTLSNGMNSLDFFHFNYMKTKRPRGARAASESILNVSANVSDKMVGADFVNPAEAALDKSTQTFIK